jgi:hypothetical protein
VIRRQRGIVPGTHCRGDGATRRKRDENGTRVTKAKHGYVYVCACMRRACRRAVAEVPRGLEAQFCSVNPWRRARGVYHPASEFVVPRLVTSASVFRASVLFISHPPSTPPPPAAATVYRHERLFTCITGRTSTRLRAFKVASQKPRAIRIDPAGSRGGAGARF